MGIYKKFFDNTKLFLVESQFNKVSLLEICLTVLLGNSVYSLVVIVFQQLVFLCYGLSHCLGGEGRVW